MRAPEEIKIIGDGSHRTGCFGPAFFESLFFISHTTTTLTLIGLPLKALEYVRTTLLKYPLLASRVIFELSFSASLADLRKVFAAIRIFQEEAQKFRALPRLSLYPLIPLEASPAGIRRFEAIAGFLRPAGVKYAAVVRYRSRADLSPMERACADRRLREEVIIVVPEKIDRHLASTLMRFDNAYTLHDGLNRCVQKIRGKLPKPGCNADTKRLLIHFSGRVYSCFGAYAARRPLGDLASSSLEKIVARSADDGVQSCRLCKRRCIICRYLPGLRWDDLACRRKTGDDQVFSANPALF